jgi:hypothetical protein
MNPVTELTPAELEMIRIERERKALAEAEQAAKRNLQIEKDRLQQQEKMRNELAAAGAQVAATRAFQAELGHDAKLIISHNAQTYKVEVYSNPSDPSSNNYARETVWSDTQDLPRAKITLGAYEITVTERMVYGNSRWSRATSKGYQMQCSGPGFSWTDQNRWYSSAKTLLKRITEKREASDKANQQLEQRKATATETVVARMQSEYPTATVTARTEWVRGYGKSAVYDVPFVTIALPNGITIRYRVYADGAIARESIVFNEVKDQWALLQTLSQIAVPEIKNV